MNESAAVLKVGIRKFAGGGNWEEANINSIAEPRCGSDSTVDSG